MGINFNILCAVSRVEKVEASLELTGKRPNINEANAFWVSTTVRLVTALYKEEQLAVGIELLMPAVLRHFT